MPFTFAHPAIVVPLLRGRPRWWIDPTALVCGALAPDFEYFLRARMHSSVSHTLTGWVTFDLPVALALAVLFQSSLRAPLRAAAPAWLQQRIADPVAPWWRRSPAGWVAVIACAMLGALSHLGWDALTHRTGAGVRAIGWLQGTSDLGAAGSWARYRLMQHASTGLGLLVLLGHALTSPHRGPVGDAATRRRTRRWLLLAMALGTIILPALVLELPTTAAAAWRARGHWIVAGLSGNMLGLTVGALLWHRQRAAADSR